MKDELIQSSEFINATWGHAIVWFGALWAVLWFIRHVSKDADDDLNPDKRKELGDELLRIKDRDASSWVPDFTVVFDQFFGKKHFSWKCFYRCSLISIFVFSILTYLDTSPLYALEPGVFDAGIELFLATWALIIFFALVFNVAIDYISLLETRFLLSIQIPIPVRVILDAILTFLLASLWLILLIILERLMTYD